jgi:hypothetical protein
MAESLRLTFEWDRGAIALREVRRVAKRAPAGDLFERARTETEQKRAQRPVVGIWLELRQGDRAVYRRQVRPLFPDSHEIQTGDPKRPFARAPRNTPYQVEILVPVLNGGADRLMLRERRADPDAKRGTPPREIVHVDEALERYSGRGQRSP